MSIFGHSKRIDSRQELRLLLNRIGGLEQSDEEYIEKLFSKYLADGISVQDVRKVVRQLKRDKDDDVTRAEASAVGRFFRKLLK